MKLAEQILFNFLPLYTILPCLSIQNLHSVYPSVCRTDGYGTDRRLQEHALFRAKNVLYSFSSKTVRFECIVISALHTVYIRAYAEQTVTERTDVYRSTRFFAPKLFCTVFHPKLYASNVLLYRPCMSIYYLPKNIISGMEAL